MKLRIKGNSLRLRLTQTEVEEIERGLTVKEMVSFGKQFPAFSYTLFPDPGIQMVNAAYAEHTLCISFPYEQAKIWATTSQVGIEEELLLDNGDTLHVLIEKDFQCLHKRPNEDENDHFPNPAMSPGRQL